MNGIDRLARTAGNFAWLEDRIADVTGSWVATIDDVDARLVLGARSHTHAWHAELWRERMPDLRGVDTNALVAPASDGVASFMETLASSTTTLERMVSVHRVLLPRIVTACALLLRGTNELLDAPTVRTLRLVLEDTREEVREGEMVIRSLAGDADAAEKRFSAAADAAGPLAF